MLALPDQYGILATTHPRRALGIGALAASLLAACASGPTTVAAPEVTLESVRVTRIVDGKADVSVGLRLYNPNARELAVKSLDYDITLDNRPAASGRTVRVDTLPAGGDGKVDLAGRVDVGVVATALMALGSQLPVAYRLTGTVTVQGWAPIPFSRDGKIAISKFDAAFGSRPR